MKKNQLLILLILVFSVSCTREDIPQEDDVKLSREKFMAMNLKEQFTAMVTWGGISKIDIQNLELQRVSTGTVRNFPGYSFKYCPVIDIFELEEPSTSVYSMGLRKGGPAGQILDVAITLHEENTPWVEVNGLGYSLQLNSYTEGNGQDVVQYTFTPTGVVPGTSDNYLNLIAALNNSNDGDAIRPDLAINDLRVLSLGSLQLTVVLDTEAAEALPALGTCQEVTPKGGFKIHSNGNYEFDSAKGTVIKIGQYTDMNNVSGLTVTVTYNESSTYELWGSDGSTPDAAQHENFNGKHIKDRIGNNRTIILPDGTKITLVSAGPQASVTSITIYSGSSVHHFNTVCKKLEYSTSDNPYVAQRFDELQADGETSLMEDADEDIWIYNIYNEDTPCNRVYQRVNLASRPKYNNPKQVNDLYDDPRLAHT